MRAWIIGLAVAGAVAGEACGQITFEQLPTSDGVTPVLARGVSGDGRVIAGSTSVFSTERPVVWRRVDGAWRQFILPTEGSQRVGRPVALSANGDVIAGMANSYTGGSAASGTPAVWRGVLSGSPVLETPLDDIPSSIRRGVFSGINAEGSLVAGYAVPAFQPSAPAEVWSHTAGETARLSPVGTTAYLTTFLCGNSMSGDGSVIVGSTMLVEQRTAFRWTAAGGFQPLPTPTTAFHHSHAETVSRDGRVSAGCLLLSPSTYNADARPALWTQSGRTDLPVPSGVGSSARVMALSADGSTAGGVAYSGVVPLDGFSFATARAALWIDGQATTLDRYLLERGIALPSVTLNWITGISDDGRVIVGFGTRAVTGPFAFVVTLPPPCAADLNGDGLADFTDYLRFLNLYDAADLAVDFTGDGLVDFSDYLFFLNAYEAGC